MVAFGKILFLGCFILHGAIDILGYFVIPIPDDTWKAIEYRELTIVELWGLILSPYKEKSKRYKIKRIIKE